MSKNSLYLTGKSYILEQLGYTHQVFSIHLSLTYWQILCLFGLRYAYLFFLFHS